ncbi:MAG: inositol monophosphatase family protein, partial [Pseudomonadota bacterium]
KVVGEEAAAKDPSILSYLSEEGPVWLVDPVDGTANFVEGSARFAVMVALVHQQETVAGWIYPPMEDFIAFAERGGGAQLDGETLKGRQDTPFDQAYGDYSSKYVASAHRTYLDAAFEKAAGARQGHCSAYAYLDTAKGELDFVMQYLMSPWDHAAGVLLVEEAGGTALFLEDATPYTPVPRNPRPMLAVSDASCWSDYASILKEKRV